MEKRVIIIPDSFKGSLSSGKAAAIINEILLQKSGYETICIPIADGGEGSTECILNVIPGEMKTVLVHSPEDKLIEAKYGITKDRTAIIEIAESSGITKQEKLNPMFANTYGFGEMISAALDEGIRKFLLCLGGSASTDCGLGMASALGAKFYDINNEPVRPSGRTLLDIMRMDTSSMDERLWNSSFTVMSDVENPLFGPLGAAFVYGPQKGATKEEVVFLDAGLKHISNVYRQAGFKDPAILRGAGAAGGAGYGCFAFLNAKIESGIDALLDFCDFDEKIKNVDFVVTGEGKFDEQSLMGKVIDGIHKRSLGKPMIVFCGKCDLSPEDYSEKNITVVEINRGKTIEESMKNAETYLYESAKEFFISDPRF